MVLLVVVIVLYIIGGLVGEQCVVIGGCKGCWSATDKTITSEMCPTAEPCRAQPYQQQRNAVVDVILCACQEAAASGYADADMNTAIQNLHSLYFTPATITEICGGQTVMSKIMYG